MNHILQQMLDVASRRVVDSNRILREENRITVTGDHKSSLIAEIEEERIKVLISHGPGEPIGFLTLFDSEIMKMKFEDERTCLDAYDYGIDLMEPKGANQSLLDNA